MSPSGNNVYSVLKAPLDIRFVMRVLEKEFPAWEMNIQEERAYATSEEAEFIAYPCSDTEPSDWFFNGSIGGDTKTVINLTLQIFQTLDLVGVSAYFEVYDQDGNEVYSKPNMDDELSS